MRIGVIGLLHESNTFIPQTTTLAHFGSDVFVAGDEVTNRFRDAPHEIGGFFEGLAAEGAKAVPLLAARATPYGVLHDEVLQRCEVLLDRQADWTKHLDGLLVAAHGAAVSQSHLDADGYWLSNLRERLGPEKPLVATLDLHANLSPRMVAAATALVGYRTNPHIDQRNRGIEAARLIARTLRGEVKPAMAAAFPRVAINIERQLTAESPCRELFAAADEMLHDERVLSNSVLLGFPYADVPEMGSSVVVVADGDLELARALADGFARDIVANRHRFAGEFLSIDEAIYRALTLGGPVCLLEMGDNVGGGSPGDHTELALAIDRRTTRPSFVCLALAAAVKQAAAAGLGGKGAIRLERSATLEYEVISLHDGKFTETGVTHGGITHFDQGPTAIVRTPRGTTIMLTSERVPPFSLRQITAFGLEPSAFHIIVAKGVHAPRAAYESVCRHFLRVDTPGPTRADMTRLDYRHRRRPLFPFEELDGPAVS